MKASQWTALGLTGALAVTLAACAPNGEGNGGENGGNGASGGDSLSVLIASSGPAEAGYYQEAAARFTEATGTEVEIVVANDLIQQLGQGFAGNNPPDLFYLPWDQFETYASQGFLEPYAGDLANAGDFLPALVEQFSYNDEFYCAPKDFSTLGLQINTEAWEAAGLTDADVPTTWDELATVAEALTDGDQVGLSMGREYARVGVFMNQAGGQLVDGDTVTADTAENAAGLEYLQGLIADGSLVFPPDLEAGWGGEAFGLGRAAMVVEGPWINGAMANDFPDREFISVELPAGPGGPSTYSFATCWGMPIDSDTRDSATAFVEFVTTPEEQLLAAEAFGVIPSTTAGADTYASQFPENAAFVAGVDYAVSPVAFAGAAAAVSEFNTELENIANANPSALLAGLQTNLQSALDSARG
ncbi:sugar ABC transporter substrate-binding protein [Microcella alkaliphila]|uniref:ABC-type sugar transport system, periplasmic com ponent n=1 Tax=Microcella alkaliphila TaxID=279828 RepID=A0A0U5B961_9MICO|nr:extracellular solute-binding protein [Microcella alkaliphila]BAU31185.1 ABC-type sugar transport system, periplasmic com ponent [Microcella alkaliphila]